MGILIMEQFKEQVYELAFGDDAINKDYSDEEVLKKLFNDLQILQCYIEQHGEMDIDEATEILHNIYS
jgi:hypothetical protein